MFLAMGHKAIKVVIDREQAIDQGATDGLGSKGWIKEESKRAMDQGVIKEQWMLLAMYQEGSDGSGSNKSSHIFY
jgi:hypothetical protein